MHAIEIQKDAFGNDVALAGFRREPAWHILGNVKEELCLRDTGLGDWGILGQPAYVKIGDEFVEVDPKLGQVMTRRLLNGTRAPLSMVGPNIVPHQNEDLEVFARALLEIGADSDNPLIFEAGGSLMDGRRVWLLFQIPGTFEVGGDKFARYLVVETSHDGRGATRAYVTYIRVVCWNTLTAASSAAANKYTIRHTGKVYPQMAVQAREVLGLHLKVDPVMSGIVDEWQNVAVSDGQWDEIVKTLVPDVPKHFTDRQKRTVARKRVTLNDLYFTSPTIGQYKGTKWGAVNAITEAYQWAPGSQTSAESLAKRQMVGAAANERAAVRLVDAVLNV